MNMNASNPLDLHGELQNDVTGNRRTGLLARLRALNENCQAAKRQLHDREAFRRLQAASVAVSAAIQIVEKLPKSRAAGN
jgi:hypothetical protein